MNGAVTQPRTGSAIRSPKVVERRARIRASLIEIGARLFAERGVEHVSVEDIIEQAGISRRTFYGFFANKYELVGSILNPVLEAGAKRLKQLPGQDAAQLLPGIVECYLELWNEYAHALSLIASVDAAALPYIDNGHRKFGAALIKALRIAERAAQLRNSSAEDSFKVLTRTAIPLLKIYGNQVDGPALYRDSMLALLGAQGTD